MSVSTGTVTARLIGTEVSQDPDRGQTWTLIFQTTNLASANETEAYYLARGARSVKSDDQGLYTLRVTLPEYSDSPADAVDKYELDIEYVTESLWKSPRVIAFLGAGDYTTFRNSQNAIEEKFNANANRLASPVNGSYYTGLSSLESQVMDLLVMGADSHEVERLVLRRQRTLPYFAANRMQLAYPGVVYTTLGLISTFSIPTDVAALFSNIESGLPAAPEGTAWRWKRRKCTAEVLRGEGKVVETMDWLFGAWSTILYPLA